jgi:hypothetical protein
LNPALSEIRAHLLSRPGDSQTHLRLHTDQAKQKQERPTRLVK